MANYFEDKIKEVVSKRKDWKILNLPKVVKHNGKNITDHDLVLFQETTEYVFLLELQLKDKETTPKYTFFNPKLTSLGFMTYDTSRGIQYKQWAEDEDLIEHYSGWWKNETSKINMEDERRSPIYQIHKSVIDTIGWIKEKPKNIHLPDFKNKIVIISPVILIGNYSKYCILLSQFKEEEMKDMKDYLSEVMDIELKGNFEGKLLTIYIVGENLLSDFLDKMSEWVKNNCK